MNGRGVLLLGAGVLGALVLVGAQAPALVVPGAGVVPTFGARLLARARRDVGVVETSQNRGPRIDEAIRAVGLSPPQPWCAAMLTVWIRDAAAELGIAPPIAGSALAKGLRDQAMEAGLWHPVPLLELAPGDVLIWHRGPAGGIHGHAGVVELIEPFAAHTLEANSGANGDRVAEMDRAFSDPELLGAIRWLA